MNGIVVIDLFLIFCDNNVMPHPTPPNATNGVGWGGPHPTPPHHGVVWGGVRRTPPHPTPRHPAPPKLSFEKHVRNCRY